jgi:hypothetical protein
MTERVTEVRTGWCLSVATLALIVFLLVGAGGITVHEVSDDDDVDNRKPILVSPPAKRVTEPLSLSHRISLPDFKLHPGGILEWSNNLRLGYGGVGPGAAPIGDLIRAQRGGNITLEPQGDYMRCAIDLLPTAGKLPDLDAIGELTIHRIHPTATDHEMISYSGLGTKNGVYGIIVEAHGQGKLRPLVFMTVQGGLNKGEENFTAEAMRMNEDGTIALGVTRIGGKLKRPIDSLTIHQPDPEKMGAYDSDYLRWIGKTHDGEIAHQVNWRINVDVKNKNGDSNLVVESGFDGANYRKRVEITDSGDVEFSSVGSGVILRSPNGKRWKMTVENDGSLRTDPMGH